jgi:hypothetical protein
MAVVAGGMTVVIFVFVYDFIGKCLTARLRMRMRAIVMSSCVFITMQNLHNIEVAQQAENRGAEHYQGLLDNRLMEEPLSSLNK